MKADEPHAPNVKYGMTAEYMDCIVQRHFDVLDGERAIHAACLAHNMRVGPAMLAALNRTAQPSMPAPVVTEPVAPEPVYAGPDLRGQLGLK